MYREMKLAIENKKKNNIETLKQEFDAKKADILNKYYDTLRSLQSVCPHMNKCQQTDFDYHKREEWTETYCEDCGKLLSRV